MNGLSQILADVMNDARAGGEEAEPSKLLDALNADENPIMALANFDRVNAVSERLYEEFGFLRWRGQPTPLGPEQRSRWTALLRWLIRELRGWGVSTDPVNRRLAAMLVVAQASDIGDAFWQGVPEDIGSNPELVACLKALLRSYSISFAVGGNMPVPIWEQEAVEAFQEADRAGDWAEIGSRLRLFEHQLIPTTVLIQSARCLYRCGVAHMVDATANLRETLIALQMAQALRADQRLRLAATSRNPYVEFAGVYQTISNRHAAEQLSTADEQMLTDVLLKVASDEPRWQVWMKLFNSYPVRYPVLQAPLGAALAEAREVAIDAYIDSIVLTVNPIKPVIPSPNPNLNRQCIASCLRRFQASASSERRALLWGKAHARWSIWNFDQGNPQDYLSSLSRCDLDYALVGFAVECMNDSDRAEVRNAVAAELNTLEDDWYVSSMDIVSRFHRILSKFQPYAHAAIVLASSEDWLTDARIYYPFVPGENEYLVMKYRLDPAG